MVFIILACGNYIYHILDVPSVAGSFDGTLIYRNGIGPCIQILPCRNGVGGVYIYLEIGNNLDMVPQFVLKIIQISQLRVERTHNSYNGLNLLIPLLFVRNAHNIINHLLHVPTIFRHKKFVSLSVIIHICTIVNNLQK